jgi:hypothetical protein
MPPIDNTFPTGMKPTKLLAIFSICVSAFLLANCESTSETPIKATEKLQAFGVNDTIQGKTYKQWVLAWWEQMNLTPKSANILYDETGANVLSGISVVNGNVLFLGGIEAGGRADTVVRTSTIPSGKTLFMPVLNGQLDTVGFVPQWSSAKRYAFLRDVLDRAVDLSVTIDDSVFTNLKALRITGDSFNYIAGADNMLGYPEGMIVDNVAHDGYYFAVKPLSKGTHHIHIFGNVQPGDFISDVTYHLTVE